MQATIEEVDRVNALTERVKKRIEEFRTGKINVSSARSHWLTESWKETGAEPIMVRRAKGFQKFLENAPIFVKEDELIVGSETKEARGCFAYPEWDPYVFIDEFKADSFTWTEDFVELELEKEEKQQILEDAQYWVGKSVAEKMWRLAEELHGSKLKELDEAKLWQRSFSSPPSGATLDYPKLLNRGLRGVIEEIKGEMDRPKPVSAEDFHKLNVWRSMIIGCEAVIMYARRHAELARKLVEEEPEEVRKSELLKIAEICEWVPENPARTFYEALQSCWFIHLAQILETAAFSKSPGRFDQYVYPFYEKDIRGGNITRQEAAELLACYWVKLNEAESFKSRITRESSMASQVQNLTIGGVKEDGSDATNELSYLILEVQRQTGLPQPQVTLRYHDGLPHEFLIKAVETTRDVAGKPAFFNDKVAILGLCQSGIPLAEARDWAPQGCVEKYIPASSGSYRRWNINFAKALEFTLNNGIDPRSGKQLFPATGDPRDFSSFGQLYEALKKQFTYLVETGAALWNIGQLIRAQEYPIPFHSSLQNDCIKRGLDAMEGGLRWMQLFTSIDVIGHQNVVDSLAAIKKLVFEEKAISMAELLDALHANFEGKEKVRAMLLAAPKYGNDDDYVDEIMVDVFKWTEEIVKSQRSVWGYPYCITRKGLTLHEFFGKVVGALPEGRKAWEPLADGSLSPMRGVDTKGPTAVFNSAAKTDQVGSEATLINQKFHRSALETRESMDKLLSLIKTYFDNSGYHVQFNIFDPQTLLDAKEHPEKYRDLVVRVAGFSAYFVELAPEVQDEIIARTTMVV